MNNTLTVLLGITAIVLPLIAGSFVWKRFDARFGRNDSAYQNTLTYFLKKLGLTILTAFILLWMGISLVFNMATSQT